MSLKKRNGVYVADLRSLGGARVSLKTTDAKLAKDRYRVLVRESDRWGERFSSGRAHTLQEVYDSCLRTEWKQAKDQRGITSRWRTLCSIIPPDRLLERLTYETMLEVVTARPKWSPKTVNRHLALLSKLLTHAVDLKWLPAMPRVPWQKVKDGGRVRWYTDAELHSIHRYFAGIDGNGVRSHLPDVQMGGLVCFLLDTGWRLGEACGPFEVYVENSTPKAILWDQKSSKRSATPLTPRAYTAAAARAWAGLSVDQVDKRWAKMRGALALGSGANVHALRHTCATRLIEAGVTVPEVRAFMRHAGLNTTMGYVHLVNPDLSRAVAALSETHSPA